MGGGGKRMTEVTVINNIRFRRNRAGQLVAIDHSPPEATVGITMSLDAARALLTMLDEVEAASIREQLRAGIGLAIETDS
jgi:hypothetical protein